MNDYKKLAEAYLDNVESFDTQPLFKFSGLDGLKTLDLGNTIQFPEIKIPPSRTKLAKQNEQVIIRLDKSNTIFKGIVNGNGTSSNYNNPTYDIIGNFQNTKQPESSVNNDIINVYNELCILPINNFLNNDLQTGIPIPLKCTENEKQNNLVNNNMNNTNNKAKFSYKYRDVPLWRLW